MEGDGYYLEFCLEGLRKTRNSPEFESDTPEILIVSLNTRAVLLSVKRYFGKIIPLC
jgi:hypothetical protein